MNSIIMKWRSYFSEYVDILEEDSSTDENVSSDEYDWL